MISREKCLEWAVECGFIYLGQNISPVLHNLINRAYADGARDMRERAANVCEQQDELLEDLWTDDSDHDTGLYRGADACAAAIRALEIE